MTLNLCVDGWKLYHVWSDLLDEKRPRASHKDIAEAKKMYIEHRRECKECDDWREE